MARVIAPSIRTLLARVIDYAGLFPPAGLDMERAAANYASYLDSEHAWMLGAFVVPAARLAELQSLIPLEQRPWTVSVLAGGGDAPQIEEFVRSGAALVPWVEVKGAGRAGLPPHLGAYHEISGPALLSEVRAAGGRAKFRTGGVTPEGFPSSEALAGSIRAALAAGVPFKCTAGLHHAVRSEHRVTYDPDSPRAAMHGFLNVLVATVTEPRPEILEERSPEAFHFDEAGLRWRDLRATNDQIRRARETGMISFGSCSFDEPVEELTALGLL